VKTSKAFDFSMVVRQSSLCWKWLRSCIPQKADMLEECKEAEPSATPGENTERQRHGECVTCVT
jgi:hypothetical protein